MLGVGARPTGPPQAVVVLFDAINEYSHPKALFRSCVNFVESPDIPDWVKVVVTCRPLP